MIFHLVHHTEHLTLAAVNTTVNMTVNMAVFSGNVIDFFLLWANLKLLSFFTLVEGIRSTVVAHWTAGQHVKQKILHEGHDS